MVEFTAKLTLFGESAVGKTSLIRRFVEDKYDDKYITTIGTKVSKKRVKITEKDTLIDVTLMIWDIMGQKGFRALLEEAYFSGASAAIGVCDITRRDTLDALGTWIESIIKVTGNIPIIILANKCDLIESAQFGEKELSALAARYNAQYMFTSAKTGENVEGAFRIISERMVRLTVTYLHKPVIPQPEKAKPEPVETVKPLPPPPPPVQPYHSSTLPPPPSPPPPPPPPPYHQPVGELKRCPFCGTLNMPGERQCRKCAERL